MVNKTEIGAYYFPGWGREYNEWGIVKFAKPYFEGHYQQKVPLEGYYDDNNPETIRRQIKNASENGVDAFIFDWYWKNGKMELRKPLDLFLQNSGDMKFAVMWPWKKSKKNLPVSPGEIWASENERWVETSPQDFTNLMKFCNENYFSRENYWKVEGRPYFVMYFVEGFSNMLGKEKLKEIILEGKEFFRNRKLAEPYIVGVMTSAILNSAPRDFGFDALTGYNLLPDFTKEMKDMGVVLQDYETLANQRVLDWRKLSNLSQLPFSPSISVGWDATPRGIRVKELSTKLGFPWSPIVINGSPKKFAEFLEQGVSFANESTGRVHICAWNEWSEGAYLEPDKKHGFAYLESIRKLRK